MSNMEPSIVVVAAGLLFLCGAVNAAYVYGWVKPQTLYRHTHEYNAPYKSPLQELIEVLR